MSERLDSSIVAGIRLCSTVGSIANAIAIGLLCLTTKGNIVNVCSIAVAVIALIAHSILYGIEITIRKKGGAMIRISTSIFLIAQSVYYLTLF